MASMTITTEAAHIGEVWLPEVIRAQEYELVIAPRVNRSWSHPGFGDVIHVPRSGNLTVATKAAGVAWTPEALTDTEQTLTINIHQVCGFQLEDIAALLSNTALKQEYQSKIGYALGRAVDVNLATLPQSFSQSVGALGDDVDYDTLTEAWQILADAGISTADNYSWFFTPAAIRGLLKQDIILDKNYRSEGNAYAVEKAKVGTILAAPVLQSNLIRSPASGQAECFLMDQRAIALVMAQEPKMVTEYIAKELGTVVGAHQIYGMAEVNRYDEAPGNVTATDNWAVLINTVG